MLALNTLCSTLLALISITSAAPAPLPENSFEGLTTVEFKGKTLYVNTAALNNAPASPVERSILARGKFVCDGSSIQAAPSGPYPQVSDCWVLRDYANANDRTWTITNRNGGYTTLATYQTCAFKAGTDNILPTKIGSGDVSDLVRDSINTWAVGNDVGARGDMGCPHPGGQSGVRWVLETV